MQSKGRKQSKVLPVVIIVPQSCELANCLRSRHAGQTTTTKKCYRADIKQAEVPVDCGRWLEDCEEKTCYAQTLRYYTNVHSNQRENRKCKQKQSYTSNRAQSCRISITRTVPQPR